MSQGKETVTWQSVIWYKNINRLNFHFSTNSSDIICFHIKSGLDIIFMVSEALFCFDNLYYSTWNLDNTDE